MSAKTFFLKTDTFKPNKIPLIVHDTDGKQWMFFPNGLVIDPVPSWSPLPAESPGNIILSSRWNNMETAIQDTTQSHIHDGTTGTLLTFAVPSAISAGGSNSAGSASTYVRSDHVHAASTAAPTTTEVIATAAAAGTATTFSRSDHTHGMSAGTTTPVTQAFSDVAAVGTSTDFARGDHKHGMPASSNKQIIVGDSDGGIGSSTTFTFLSGQVTATLTDNIGNGARSYVPIAGTFKNFFVALSTAPGGTLSRTATVMKNGVATSLLVTITGAETTGSDTVDSFSVVAADQVNIKWTVSGSPPVSTPTWGLEFDPS